MSKEVRTARKGGVGGQTWVINVVYRRGGSKPIGNDEQWEDIHRKREFLCSRLGGGVLNKVSKKGV